MTKRNTNIKQHFVGKNGKLIVYNVNRNNTYSTSPARESYKKYFYDINSEILKIFSTSATNHEEVVDDKIRILNEREILYDFIILQIIRTPSYRERLDYLHIAFALISGINNFSVVHNLLVYGVIERLYSLDFNLDKICLNIL